MDIYLKAHKNFLRLVDEFKPESEDKEAINLRNLLNQFGRWFAHSMAGFSVDSNHQWIRLRIMFIQFH